MFLNLLKHCRYLLLIKSPRIKYYIFELFWNFKLHVFSSNPKVMFLLSDILTTMAAIILLVKMIFYSVGTLLIYDLQVKESSLFDELMQNLLRNDKYSIV